MRKLLLFLLTLHSFFAYSDTNCKTTLWSVADSFREWVIDHKKEILVTVVVCSGAGVGYWYWYKHRFIFRPIILNGASVHGVTKNYRDIVITQVKVKNQFDADGGGNASCGYHAVRNARLILRALSGKTRDLQSSLLDAKNIDYLFGKEGVWRTKVKERRKNGSNGEWIGSNELHHFVNDADDYIFIEDIGMVTNPAFDTKSISTIRERIRREDKFTCTFFMNTAQHATDKNNRLRITSGHWIPVILHQTDRVTRNYIIADSCDNMNRLHDPKILTLIDALEKK